MYTVSEATLEWQGRTGRVDAQLVAGAAAGRPGAMYYASGPPAFVERVRGAVASLGVPNGRLRLEVFKNYDEP